MKCILILISFIVYLLYRIDQTDYEFKRYCDFLHTLYLIDLNIKGFSSVDSYMDFILNDLKEQIATEIDNKILEMMKRTSKLC